MRARARLFASHHAAVVNNGWFLLQPFVLCSVAAIYTPTSTEKISPIASVVYTCVSYILYPGAYCGAELRICTF